MVWRMQEQLVTQASATLETRCNGSGTSKAARLQAKKIAQLRQQDGVNVDQVASSTGSSMAARMQRE